MSTYRRFKVKIAFLLAGTVSFGFFMVSESFEWVSKKPEMVLIEGGTFEMGQSDGEADERPVHEVQISNFYLAKFEVTVSEYREFCDLTGREMPDEPAWGWIDDHPIINTSWNDANSYINWLNEEFNESFRLPTEAEFEFVIRNGGEAGTYSWGTGIPIDENLADQTLQLETARNRIWKDYSDGYAFTSPVGSFEANKLGVYDINGNIWEWCSDWYGPYTEQKMINPLGEKSGRYKVGRGGSYDSDPWHSRSASRAYVEPNFKRPGFRLAKDFD